VSDKPLVAPHTAAELEALSESARDEYWREFLAWLGEWFVPTHAFAWPYSEVSTGRLRVYPWPECALEHPELVDKLLHGYAWDTNLRRGLPKTGRDADRFLWGHLVQQIASHIQQIGIRCGAGHEDSRRFRAVRPTAPAQPPPPHERRAAQEAWRPAGGFREGPKARDGVA